MANLVIASEVAATGLPLDTANPGPVADLVEIVRVAAVPRPRPQAGASGGSTVGPSGGRR